MLFGFLPVVSWYFIWTIYFKKGLCWRSSFLAASVTWGVIITASTESLSLFRLLTFNSVLAFWGGVNAILLFTCYFINSVPREEGTVAIPESSTFLKVLLWGIFVILFFTGLIASVAPPNNWDSMTYHMSRVVHWMQNKSVWHYPTHILRQIELNPWAEFAITHLQILSGGDYWANFVQWFSMLGSLIGVSLVAKEFDTDARGQAFAAVFAATLPMGILQSTSTQNDYAVSFWLICFVYYGILIHKKTKWPYVLAFSASLGLAFLTKGTAYLYALPFFIFFMRPLIKANLRSVIKPLLIIAAVVLLINLGHFSRNISIFSNPLQSGEISYSNESFTPASLISNISRNMALHMGTPWKRVNGMTERVIGVLHTILNKDINDPKTTYADTSFKVTKTSLFEDRAGNALHLLLIIFSMVVLLSDKQLRSSHFTGFSCVLIGGFLLFCFYLKWQPWGSRLHLPLFLLWAPFVAGVLSRSRYQYLINSIAVFCLIASFPWVIANKSRPIWGQNSIFLTNRMDNYFSTQPWTKYSYYSAAAALNGLNCNSIGLEIGGNDFEYPLWVLIQKVPTPPRIEHVNVTNESKNIPLDNFTPCAVIKSDKNKKLSVNWISVTRADLITEAVPPGFTVEGMGELEGPYPQWNLPHVRWAKNPDVQIEFMGNADKNNPVKLSISFRPLARDFAKMTILLNNIPVKHYEVGNETWHDDIVGLVTRRGANLLEVRFDPLLEEKSPNESLYMLFRKFALESDT